MEKKKFGTPQQLFLVNAPGRINIIGEHTDYNHGFVFPCALERYVSLVFQLRKDTKLRVLALDLEKDNYGEVDLNDATFEGRNKIPRFLHYIVGQAAMLRKLNNDKALNGFDAVLSSTIPIGGGVSSSSALSVASSLAFRKSNPDFKPSNKDHFTSICEGEWTWSGVRGGIMDQYTSLNAKEGHAFILDCRTSDLHTKYKHVPLPKNLAMLVANTNVKHELVGSPYNERRSSCERAVEYVQGYLNSPDNEETTEEEKELKKKYKGKVTHLRDVSLELLHYAADHTKLDARAYRRAHHSITEDDRTIHAAEAFLKGDLKTVGHLLNKTHASLRDFYRVSCDELDAMVDIAQHLEGVYGARMMGGGFGGCAIVLVEPEKANKIQEKLEAEYKKRVGKDATIIPSKAGAGAHVVSL